MLNPKLFYPQTFLIFDGESLPINENTLPNPLCIYGKHKLQAELLLNDFQNSLVVIMGGFFGGRELDKNFVGKIIPHISQLIKSNVTSIEVGDILILLRGNGVPRAVGTVTLGGIGADVGGITSITISNTPGTRAQNAQLATDSLYIKKNRKNYILKKGKSIRIINGANIIDKEIIKNPMS